MIKSALLSFFLFLSVDVILAQTKDVTRSMVIDYETKLPITNASVNLIKNKKSIYITQTDSTGAFVIPLNMLSTYTIIKISRLNYHTLEIFKKNNSERSPPLKTYELSPKGIELKEVVIKKNKRYRDTSIIDLSKETFERSIMIEDLFSQRGLSKDANGKLFYKGNPVADILVNSGNFFGKNNIDIYKYLPALTLNNIEIVETTIDSLTHTTLLIPNIKVNLKLKEKFEKGKFGSSHLGYGTLSRYLFSTDLYNYKNNEQIALVLNANNINSGDNPYIEPNVSFSTNGNNSTGKSAKLGYRNLYYHNKIELEASVKGKVEQRKFDSETIRKEENFNQLSKTTNTSDSKSSGIEAAHLNINYRIDTLNTLILQQTFSHNKIDQIDSLGYLIESETMNTISRMSRIRQHTEHSFSNGITYQKLFTSKRGRTLDGNYVLNYNKINIEEGNTIFSSKEKIDHSFFIRGNRAATQKKSIANISFTEPINEQGYLKTSISYSSDKIDYNASRISDSIPNFKDHPSNITNRYLSQDLVFKYTLDKMSLGGTIDGVINFRKTIDDLNTRHDHLFLLNANLNTDYKINHKKRLSANYTRSTNYPTINQLTAINNSFDLVSQMKENIELKPEIKNRTVLSYEYKKSDSLTLSLTAGIDLYQSKFGLNTINNTDISSQITFIDNIGTAKSYDLSLAISRTSSQRTSISYRFGVNYTDQPIIISQQNKNNKGIQINQTLMMGFSILKILTISPGFSSTIARYNYGETKSNLLALTYSDKISLNMPGKLLLNIYPIVNYSYNINHTATWSVNAGIEYDILKKYGKIWIKAYDLFNSFNYVNNYLSPSYTQSIKFANLNRYAILGFSMKFNNMK